MQQVLCYIDYKCFVSRAFCQCICVSLLLQYIVRIVRMSGLTYIFLKCHYFFG